MNKDLSRTLVKKNIICKGTELLATIKKTGVGGVTMIKPTKLIVGTVGETMIGTLFTCIDPETKQQIEIIHSQILSVDGMEPERLGKTFNVNPDGSLRAPGKKRGRKPKNK